MVDKELAEIKKRHSDISDLRKIVELFKADQKGRLDAQDNAIRLIQTKQQDGDNMRQEIKHSVELNTNNFRVISTQQEKFQTTVKG